MSKPFALDDIAIASPCPAEWAQMSGDERSRFCGACKKHVYDLSAMTRAQAVRTIVEKEGRLCARLYRRADGTVLTADCPRGLADVAAQLHITSRSKKGIARWLYAGAAMVLLLMSGSVVFGDNIRHLFGPPMMGALAGRVVRTAPTHSTGVVSFAPLADKR
jgi:hypothetical protein